MVNLENVIKGLECCRRGFCFACPYNDGIDENVECKQKWADDALAMLKAHEPREPHFTKLEYNVNGMKVSVDYPECPRCVENGLALWDAEIERGVAFCKRCGQAVKWQ